jgi:glucan biosynthesis protein|tara:strand:- start:902 stop:1165 length:264 start_codon:yes stop_codon:yes gene_type:complete
MENTLLTQNVDKQNPMKTWMVDYVGEKLKPEDEQITVEMIVGCMAEEFPEFLMAVAEENWIRGYRQAFKDIEVGMKAEVDQENESSS